MRYISRLKTKILPYLLLFLLGWLSGCASSVEQQSEEFSASELYDNAADSMADFNYSKAAEYLGLLRARYPLSAYAQQSQLDLAYAYMNTRQHARALQEVNRFIVENPRHPRVDYALYLRGLADYYQGFNIVNLLNGYDFSDHSPLTLQRTYGHFAELVERYPNSLYAPYAKQRMLYLYQQMALHEYYAAGYYYRRGAPIAALDRLNALVPQYPDAPIVPDALAFIYVIYNDLELPEEAQVVEQVLRLQVPDHPVLTGSWQPPSNW